MDNESHFGKIFAKKCDLTNEEDILEAFKWIQYNHGGIDVLINNAGLMRSGFVIDGQTSDFQEIINTNILASCICIREAVKDMRERNALGHIVVVNRYVNFFYKIFPCESFKFINQGY